MLKEWNCNEDISVNAIADRVRSRMEGLAEADDFRVREMCTEEVMNECFSRGIPFSRGTALVRQVFCTLRCELSILQDLADDPRVSEIMVNGCSDIFIEKGRGMEKTDLSFENREDLEQVIRRLAARVGREINDMNPIVDARLSDGSRVNAVHSSIALDGPVLTIRKFTKTALTMDELISQGDISPEAADLLRILVRCGYNIFVCGGTSSGKTTFLNVLSDFIPPEERLVVIEDSAELQIRGHANLVRLESRNSNAQGRGSISIRDLIRTSLRMRPDRVIVGEVRGPEVIDMLSAMSTGHDGSLSTGHGNSPASMLGRLETMVLSGAELPADAVRAQIGDAIDIFVHLARTGDGHRRVMEICELEGYIRGEYKLSSLFSYIPGKGLLPTGNRLKNRYKLDLRGGDDLERGLQAL